MEKLELMPIRKPRKLANAVFEVEAVYRRPLLVDMQKITSSKDAESILRAIVQPDKIDLKECFFAIYLTRSNHVLGVAEISSGSTNACLVNTKEIFQIALRLNASAIVASHNHPSGQLKPSGEDVESTKRLKEAGKLLDIHITDHIILTSEGYLSFADDGLL